jgi:nucleotide-binding universal stress UspA family protein
VGKFTGAFVGGTIGGLSRAESLALGCGMNARGSTEVIVATIGLSMSVLSQNLFTLIVTMAVLTTLAMPPMLRWSLRRLPLNKKEQIRLKREELDAKGFVVNLERLLLAADDSANGKFASRLAGAIAGSGGKPTTILELNTSNGKKKPAKKGGDSQGAAAEAKASDGGGAEYHVKAAAKETTTLETHPDEEKPGKADVIKWPHEVPTHEAVAEQAGRGYDFLIVGVGKTRNPKGGFTKEVTAITNGFEGAVAVVDAHVSNGKDVRERGGRILLPVHGTDVSRRAAEVALALARASDAHVTALYVTRTANSGSRSKTGPRKRASRRNEQAVLKDIAALAARYDVAVRSTTRSKVAPDEAILREAKRGYDLIVLGVSKRPGEALYFGNTATSILDHSDTSNLFVAS